jgi:peptidoglycan biosynthesis protein MviN/MurJ (putative lipid II flippase)
VVDGDLRARHRPLTNPRARPRDRRAYYFGAAGKINAFTVAFQVPNLVRSLVADAALSSAFVPVFSELLEKGDKKRAWRVASTLFWLMLLGLGALVRSLIVIAPLVIAPFGNPGGDKSWRSDSRACSSRSSRCSASPA